MIIREEKSYSSIPFFVSGEHRILSGSTLSFTKISLRDVFTVEILEISFSVFSRKLLTVQVWRGVVSSKRTD